LEGGKNGRKIRQEEKWIRIFTWLQREKVLLSRENQRVEKEAKRSY